ncbi:MAG: hypothetical protein QN141_01615 [Armatimonadota bacterium]|nr:hypothetical protein [Armatimonadota bacterium]MDR7451021.1 hypothetical protein [Armatimonadota bacterium]MDR7465958.1 hypothetical protein [Armatimonadota bacterium]MDR7494023.1 hypothetical protein [Armatimonadota bacterium]MDR7498473.1 hypothetical protein [Armatimonadota bacterium]
MVQAAAIIFGHIAGGIGSRRSTNCVGARYHGEAFGDRGDRERDGYEEHLGRRLPSKDADPEGGQRRRRDRDADPPVS